jgi:putative alpha-1,2-mannosidase
MRTASLLVLLFVVIMSFTASAQLNSFPESYKIDQKDVDRARQVISAPLQSGVEMPNPNNHAQWFPQASFSLFIHWGSCGNEPNFGITWAYNWAGQPYKTQEIVQCVICEQYFNKPEGLPGNDDLSAMGFWYVFACIGLYPEIPRVGGFSINSPIFPYIKICLKGGNLTILGGSEKNNYINAMKFNGKTYMSTWIDLKNVANNSAI